MKIIGIDPGYDRLGIAIVEKSSPKEKEVLIYSECFTPAFSKNSKENKKNLTKKNAENNKEKIDIYERLSQVGARVKELIEQYRPNGMAIETLFITKNQKTAMHVSEARGIVIYEGRQHDLPIFEYSPPQIKMAITGDGRSDKNQIIKMIPLLIKMDIAGGSNGSDGPKSTKAFPKKHDDEYDAIAVALTCIACNKVL